VRILDLTENLGFANDQRVEPGRDAEEMPCDFGIHNVVDVRLHRLSLDVVKLGNEAHEIPLSGVDVVARRVEFGAVTGRQEDRLSGRPASADRSQRSIEAARLKVDPFPQLHGGGTMTHAY
jgi:hypothetical protein